MSVLLCLVPGMSRRLIYTQVLNGQRNKMGYTVWITEQREISFFFPSSWVPCMGHLCARHLRSGHGARAADLTHRGKQGLSSSRYRLDLAASTFTLPGSAFSLFCVGVRR